jgi:beta-galactosidase
MKWIKFGDIEYPFFVSVVLWKWEEWPDKEIEEELKRIEDTGFNSIRVFFDRKDIEYELGKFKWDNPDRFFKIVSNRNLWVFVHPGCGVHPDIYKGKRLIMEEEIFENIRYYVEEVVKRYKNEKNLAGWFVFGEPEAIRDDYISEEYKTIFGEWLKKEYKTIENLNRAWGLRNKPFNEPPVKNFNEAYKLTQKRFGTDHRIRRDLIRFQTDISIENQKRILDLFKKLDPEHPVRSGGHHILSNAPYYRWDWEKTASICDIFVSSIHIPWHFEPVEGEEDIPLYIQAKLIQGFGKEVIPAAPETTGGSSRYSGSRPFLMTVDKIKRFMFFYISSGLKGFGFWCWNPRERGYEAGEYGLIDLLGDITDWAKIAGKISKKITEYRKELWLSKLKPEVYIFYSWDNEAFAYRISEGTGVICPISGHELNPSFSRIGCARALINRNIPFEFITDNQFLEGKILKTKIVFLPWMEMISENILEKLYEYGYEGGRIVADIPIGYFNEFGELLNTKKGSIFEKLFGCSIRHFLISTGNSVVKFNGYPINEQWADIILTDGKIISHFDNGKPAIIENKIGKGSSCLILFSLSKICKNKGNKNFENILVDCILNSKDYKYPFIVDEGVIYSILYFENRIEHVFFVNLTDEKKIIKIDNRGEYKEIIDVIDERKIKLRDLILFDIEGRDSKWLRIEKWR